MKFTFLTLFPDFCTQAMNVGVIGKGVEKNRLQVEVVNIRDFTKDNYGAVDDMPYGGGPGMVLKVEPVVAAVESLNLDEDALLFLLSPRGKVFKQAMARTWKNSSHLVFICGRYEGVDERIREILNPIDLSVGDFVLTGGELAALSVADAVGRLVPGVLGDESSVQEESFSESGIGLEYPHYTRPQTYRGHEVPEVLLSGHHKAIEEWRIQKSREITSSFRPDLIAG